MLFALWLELHLLPQNRIMSIRSLMPVHLLKLQVVSVFNPNNWMGYLFLPPSKPDYPHPNFEVVLFKRSGLPRKANVFQYPLPPLAFSSIATLSSSNCAISPSSPVQTSEGWPFQNWAISGAMTFFVFVLFPCSFNRLSRNKNYRIFLVIWNQHSCRGRTLYQDARYFSNFFRLPFPALHSPP